MYVLNLDGQQDIRYLRACGVSGSLTQGNERLFFDNTNFRLYGVWTPFFSAVKKDTIFGAARNFFGPSYFVTALDIEKKTEA